MLRDPFQLVGTTIDGKYRVERVIGEGGFGVVYQGTHALLGQPIAIKCLKPLGGGLDDERKLTELFLREARVLFGLGHPGIVRLYDVGSLATAIYAVPYVVLEYLEGPTLEDELARRAVVGALLSAEELLAIFAPVLEAVAFAHDAGVVHRDLKPSNVMLVRSAGPQALSAKVVDFGIARRAADPKNSTSATGFTPRYAAPEQWDAATFGPTTPATDVFALGLMLAEACTLRPVLDAAGPAAVLANLLDPTRTVRVTDRRRDLPAALDLVLERATRVRADERFRSARELLAAVRGALASPTQALSDAPTQWSPIGPTRPSVGIGTFAPSAAATPPPPATPPHASSTSRAPLFLAAAALAVALAAVGAFALFAWSTPREPRTASTAAEARSKKKRTDTPTAPEAPVKDEIDDMIEQEIRREIGPAADAAPRPKSKDGPSVEIAGVLGGKAPNTEKAIVNVAEKHLSALKACYTKALARDAAIQGRITLMLSLGSDGVVTNAMCAVNGASITDAPLRTCVSAEGSDWQFQKPAEGIDSFMITFEFWP